MRTYYMKIREKFLPEILAGNKKHEYRLATPERMQVKIGDLSEEQYKTIYDLGMEE